MAFVILLLIDVVLYLLNGFVLKTLWGWFMVPVFHLPNLSLAAAIGVGIVISLLCNSAPADSDKEISDQVTSVISHSLVRAIFALAAGWVTHQFM